MDAFGKKYHFERLLSLCSIKSHIQRFKMQSVMVVYLKEGKWRNDIRRIRFKKDTEKIVQLQSLLNIVKFNGMFTILLSQWNIPSLSVV